MFSTVIYKRRESLKSFVFQIEILKNNWKFILLTIQLLFISSLTICHKSLRRRRELNPGQLRGGQVMNPRSYWVTVKKKVWILTQFNLHAVLHLKIYHPANLSPCQKITIIKLSILPIIVANRMVSLFSRDRVCFNVDSTAFPFHSYINFSVFHRAVINCTLHFSLPAFTKALKYL